MRAKLSWVNDDPIKNFFFFIFYNLSSCSMVLKYSGDGRTLSYDVPTHGDTVTTNCVDVSAPSSSFPLCTFTTGRMEGNTQAAMNEEIMHIHLNSSVKLIMGLNYHAEFKTRNKQLVNTTVAKPNRLKP